VTKYPSNPIYDENGAKNVRWVVVQYQAPTYYLYYSHSGGDTDGYYATSNDGLHFTYQGYSLRRDSSPGAWDGGYIEIHTVFKYDATRWIMYYCGNPTQGYWHIGCAFSTNLITWTKYSGNPILGDSPTAADPCVVKTSAGKYLMYYASYDSRSTWQIALATSNDGLSWSRYGVVLTYKPGTWYDYYVAPTGVMELNGKILLMVIGKASGGTNQNGLFESPNLDGTSFQESSTSPSPCIPTVPGTWESQIVAHSDFEIVNGVTYIYYDAYDGVNWQLGRAQFVLTPQPDKGGIHVYGKVYAGDPGTPVECSDVYYRDSSGYTSTPISIPSSGYIWSDLTPGTYSIYGTYQETTRSVTVTVVAGQTAGAELAFGSVPPRSLVFPFEIIVIGSGLALFSSGTYLFLAKPWLTKKHRFKVKKKKR
jgi:sucrose-6-phosphate hydrolase SacC (GH32 family)